MSHTPLKDLFCAKPFEYFASQNLKLIGFSCIFSKPLDFDSLKSVISQFTYNHSESYTRHHQRIETKLSISLTDNDGNKYTGEILDISQNGLKISFSEDLNLSCDHIYSFEAHCHQIPNCHLKGSLQPRWMSQSNNEFFVGIEFLDKTKQSNKIFDFYNSVLTSSPKFC